MNWRTLEKGQVFGALSVYCGVTSGACLKLTETASNAQAVCLRSLVVVAFLGPILAASRRRRRTAIDRFTLIRSAMEASSGFALSLAVFQLPISLIMSFLSALPAFSTLAAAFLLAERARPVAWLGIAGAILGCLLILRPAFELSVMGTSLIVFAVGLYAARDVFTRKYADRFDATASVTVSNLMIVVISLFFLPSAPWVRPEVEDVAVLLLSGLFAILAGVLVLRAHQLTAVSLVAPLRFTSVLWAVLYDWLIWDFLPDNLAWAGIATILLSTLVILRANRPKLPTSEMHP